MITKEVWVAKLHEDKVSEYEKLHSRIPEAIKQQLLDKGFTNLSIYRHGLTLIMTLEIDSKKLVEDRKSNEIAELDWAQKTEICFEESWKGISRIFDLSEQVQWKE